jgi:hypothetical protein
VLNQAADKEGFKKMYDSKLGFVSPYPQMTAEQKYLFDLQGFLVRLSARRVLSVRTRFEQSKTGHVAALLLWLLCVPATCSMHTDGEWTLLGSRAAR